MRLRLSAMAAVVTAFASLSCSADRVLGPAPTPNFDHVPGTPPHVVITELMPDPSRVADASGEWFEVFNAGAQPVNLMGWRIVSGVTVTPEQHVIGSNVVIAPGGYAVLGNNGNSATNGGLTVNYAYPASGAGSIILNNSNTDWLALKMGDGTLVDSVAYSARNSSGTIVAPTTTPTSGASRAMIGPDVSVDNTLLGGGQWALTPTGTTYGLGDRGTPGSGNYVPIVPGGDPVTVTISPLASQVVQNQTKQFSAVARDVNGAVSSTTFTWTSSNTAVATISGSGLATGVAVGQTTITVTTANGVSAATTLDVVEPTVASITIAINSPREVPVGFVKPAFATVRDPGNAVISPAPPLTWSSSDPSIASVDNNGYISGLAEGVVTITATAANGVSGTSASFTVLPHTVPTTAVYRNHLEFGAPSDGNPADDIMISRPQYALSYNAARGGPNWVSWNLNASHFGAAPRCDCFSPDPLLPAGVYRVVDFDYRNGGYDRGHMVMSEPRTTTYQENATTFYLTNILPQAADNNQGPWLDFEIHLNDQARIFGREVYVIQGGEYGPAPGSLKNEGRVLIPDWTWKIAVILPAGAGLSSIDSYDDAQVIAVRMPNLTTPGHPASAIGHRTDPWENFQVTVDQIEAATGYDFLAALPDQIELLLEANDRPPVANPGGPYSGTEGSAVSFSGAGSSDPDGDALTYSWDFGDGATATGAAPSHTYADNGTYTVTLTVADPIGATHTATTTATIANAAPVITGVSLSGTLFGAGSPVSAGVTFTDAGSADTHETTFDWGDGSTGTSGTHSYGAAGFYQVSVTVRDDDGGSATSVIGTVVVYDPDAGFVTGGGWFSSGGRYHFNVEARYDGNSPEGRVDFRLQANRGIDFATGGLEYLVITPSAAFIRGWGAVAGRAGVHFVDMRIEGDVVHVRITDSAGSVVYDSGPVSLSGGTVSIHR